MSTRYKIFGLMFVLLATAGFIWFMNSDLSFFLIMKLATLADAYPYQFVGIGIFLATAAGLYAIMYILTRGPARKPRYWPTFFAWVALKVGLVLFLYGAMALSYKNKF
jgi:hypothetical protein